MAIEDGSNAELLKLWKSGNQHAAQVLVDRYMLRLTALAQSRLSRMLARRLDADDIVLSAWRSFFVAVNRSRLQVPDDDNLWPLLATFTLRKLQRQAQRQLADRRDMARDASISDDDGWRELVSREPTPDDAAHLTYDIEALLARLEPTDREILMQRLQGEELEVIASRMKCSERTVRRAMQRIRMQLADYFDVTDDPADLSPSVKARPVTDDDGRSSLPPLNTRPTPSIRYQELTLEAMIGRGGFGRVYRARWKSIDCPIAVKFLNKKFWHHDLAVRALVEESQKVQCISHRHIIRHHGWGQAPSGAPFLVMDLIDGSNLTDWIQHPSFDVSEIESCGIQICDALIALHQSGILHGDISPGNVLRRAPHDFVLTDFGFSRSVHETHLARGGTPGFLAPEQLSSAFGAISEHTDLYGFGALLYFLATRTAPFEGDDESDVLNQVLSSRSPAPISEHCGLPQKLMMGIMKCLSKVPSQRGTAMSSLRRELFRI
ncbi:MAG: protein kinase domain-containing protein [Planctomyces sp.]